MSHHSIKQILFSLCARLKFAAPMFLYHLALHLAVQHGHSDVVRRLLSESDIDVFTLNNR